MIVLYIYEMNKSLQIFAEHKIYNFKKTRIGEIMLKIINISIASCKISMLEKCKFWFSLLPEGKA